MSGEPKILIIGAGAAGIAAAVRLWEKGLKNLLILEAKDRIGGRIHTVKFSENVVELGAQWCHGENNNIVYNLASPHNLLKSSKNIHNLAKHIFVNANGEIISKIETTEILKLYYKIIDQVDKVDHEPNTSCGDYFVKTFYKEIKNNKLINEGRAEQYLNWIHSYHNSIECSDTWFNLSATRLKEYWTCEGDSLLNWKTNGYRSIFDLLTKNYPNSKNRLPIYEKILFNKQVSLIDYSSGNDVKIQVTDGTIFKATCVIFTGSLGVLKDQYSTLFKPSLPESKIQAIKGFNIGIANKIFLEFPHRWWPENIGGFSFMWSEDQKKEFLQKFGKAKQWMIGVFKFFTVDYQPRVLSGWLVGPDAQFVESLSDKELLTEIHFLLQMFLSHIYDVPQPKNIIRSKWSSDKNIRGSYSYRSLNTEKLNVKSEDLSKPIRGIGNKPIILFAGEATHKHYFGTVHGAIETGFREADNLINFYKCLKPRL